MPTGCKVMIPKRNKTLLPRVGIWLTQKRRFGLIVRLVSKETASSRKRLGWSPQRQREINRSVPTGCNVSLPKKKENPVATSWDWFSCQERPGSKNMIDSFERNKSFSGDGISSSPSEGLDRCLPAAKL